MQRGMFILVIMLCGVMATASCGGHGTGWSAGEGAAEDADLVELVRWMTGSFSSSAQAAADSAFFDIRLHMIPIWTENRDSAWLYVEQAVATNQDQPYRQRVYHLMRRSPDVLVSRVYRLPGQSRFVGAWRNPGRLNSLQPDSLLLREGCDISLRRQDSLTFVGSTAGEGCASNLRGAVYASSEVIINPQQLTAWDRGFAEDGEQVWGAVKGGYVFVKSDSRGAP